MHKGISAIAVVLIGLLGIAGCGGDSSISKAEYEQQVELACKKGLKERTALLKEIAQEYPGQKRSANAKKQAELQAENVRKVMAVYRRTTEDIADIGFPEQGEKMAEELVKQREDGAAKLEAEPLAVAEFSTIFAKANKLAEGFKVPTCAK